MFGGGLPSLPPADLAVCLPFCPHPPTPFPRGEGGDFWFSYARGSAPCIPGIKSPTALTVPAVPVSGGGCVRLVACCPCLWFAFLPPSPLPPFPSGRGIFVLFCRGLAPPAPLLLNPRGAGSIGGLTPPAPLLLNPGDAGLPGAPPLASPGLNPRGTGYAFGTQPLKYYRKYPCQCIFCESSGGYGGLFQESPDVSFPQKVGIRGRESFEMLLQRKGKCGIL